MSSAPCRGVLGLANRRVIRVGVSGVVATGIDVTALVLLVELLGSHVTLAAFLASMLGGVSNYLINKYWAFAEDSPIDVRQVSVYAFVSLVTAVFVAVAVHMLAIVMGLPYLLAKALAAGLVFLVWSYPAQSRLVFPSIETDDDDLTDDLSGDSLALE